MHVGLLDAADSANRQKLIAGKPAVPSKFARSDFVRIIPAKYQPVPDGYRIVGSERTFNRALYGGHAQDDLQQRYYTLAGDQPLFLGSTVDTRGGGSNAKCGTLMLGVSQSFGTDASNKYGVPSFGAWFHECRDSIATFRHGWWAYEVHPFIAYAPDVKAHFEILPLSPEDGFLVHLQVTPESEIEFCAGFGGITDSMGLITNQGNHHRNFSAGNCSGNVVLCGQNRASVTGPKSQMWIGTTFDSHVSIGDANAVFKGPSQFLDRKAKPSDHPMVRISRRVEAGETLDGLIVVLRNVNEEQLEKWLKHADPVGSLKQAIIDKQQALVVETPDVMLNLTVPSNVVGMDACWNQKVFCHGGTNWHSPYLGWRTLYGPTVLGWHDRVANHFLTHADPTRFTIDPKHGDGYISPELHGRGFGYNMQEVGIDMLLNDLDWTGDLQLADDVFDRISQALQFESRVFDPDGNGLYQNYLNTWVSDGHAYNGGDCAQASAYNFRANRLMEAIARKLGRDPAPFRTQADKIEQAMQQTLWLADKGRFAEYKDTVGRRLIHPSPELATIYHTIETGLADPFQAYQMLRFTRTDLRNERTIPRQGRLVWSSNWSPRSFSTCGLFTGEIIHLTWAYFQNGQTDEAHELLRGIVDTHFMSDTPGSVGHLLNATGMGDGTQDFADTVSMYLRLVVEGLYGIRFHLMEGRIDVAPGFPRDWEHAQIKTREYSLNYQRVGEVEELEFDSQRPAKRVLRLPMRGTSVSSVTLNREKTPYRLEPRVGRCDVVVETEKTGIIRLRIEHGDEAFPGLKAVETCFAGEDMKIVVANGQAVEARDPSQCLSTIQVTPSAITGKCQPSIGHNTIFIRVQSGEWHGWLPADWETVAAASESQPEPVGTFHPVEISTQFNASLTDLHKLDYASPRPVGLSLMSKRNGRSMWDEQNLGGPHALTVDDSLLRNCGGTFRTARGVPFHTPEMGSNVACASVWDNFPDQLTIPLTGSGSEIAVLLIGVTNAMQAQVENGRITVQYADGQEEMVQLINPINFDDWMIAATQRANETVRLSDFNHAIVQRLRLDPKRPLKSVTVQGTANEVIVGVLGVSVRRQPADIP